jgi:hypothetical protein
MLTSNIGKDKILEKEDISRQCIAVECAQSKHVQMLCFNKKHRAVPKLY